MKKITTIILLIVSTIIATSQSSIEAKLMFISFHPIKSLRQADTKIYENKVDENANFIRSPGIMLSYQKYIYLTRLSFQISQGFFSDAISNFAGVSSLFLKYKFYHKYKISFSLGAGPNFLFREDWHKSYRYIDNDGYILNGEYQTKWTLGTELSLYYFLNKRSDISISLLYGHEYGAFALNFGYKYWLQTNVNFKDDCTNCGNKWKKGGGFKLWWKKLWN